MPPKRVAIIGAALDLGAGRRGVDMGPSAIRYAGLSDRLERAGIEVEDRGNVQAALAETGASGAEPIDTAMGADRSADSKRGLAVTSSAIAGPMKIIIGLSCSTTSNRGSTRWSPSH